MRFAGVARSRLILASVLAVGASVAYGQNSEPEPSKETAQPPALKLSLTTLEPSVCSNRPLLLELQIENIGREEVKIDRADLWSSFSYAYLTRDSDRTMGRGGGMGSNCSHCRGRYVSLLPGTALWEKHEFQLNDFFQDEGDYSLRIQLDYRLGDKESDAESNEIEFGVRSCSSK